MLCYELSSYTPLITPFTADEEVDYDALVRQVLRLARVKMGIVLLGTNGEGGDNFIIPTYFMLIALYLLRQPIPHCSSHSHSPLRRRTQEGD